MRGARRRAQAPPPSPDEAVRHGSGVDAAPSLAAARWIQWRRADFRSDDSGDADGLDGFLGFYYCLPD